MRVLLFLGFAALTALHAASRPAVKPPNILWLIAEDAGPDFGCYGHAAVRTPNIDRLARESRLNRNAFATAPVGSVSRSAFMTCVFQTRFSASNHRPEAYPRPRKELYEWQADPFELYNLPTDPRHRAPLERLHAVLAAWLKETRNESAAPEEPTELDAQLKNLAKIVVHHRQKIGPAGRLEFVPGATGQRN